ncbi:hypothetical protein NC652_004632 [Populus alba x Populus x berolinensis]|uniref:Uncharacterized protein n=1 Tax=Populus alba x Populus x berolinensis TaxID=444605 RepID=A0AAD6RUE7_9ROSI|nr:hypothetical protein NC652_004632 [Populus alba x Populus x berolinensis]KAJ7015343.1 hypothetical protein NC653_004601 [Populus alba x Populus x berolinensis]KAJ7015345.1 hypothetical protein NC653_004603 [Populus alba x Populus x berolinensis]KAJ7015519.1 hypothetical protein NC653_004732 [Populus alba x Populus x berolinensis]KAJ7015625.1 hypothetical protein NC653_004813 [Populus alba x Populus x berolinensis]
MRKGQHCGCPTEEGILLEASLWTALMADSVDDVEVEGEREGSLVWEKPMGWLRKGNEVEGDGEGKRRLIYEGEEITERRYGWWIWRFWFESVGDSQ